MLNAPVYPPCPAWCELAPHDWTREGGGLIRRCTRTASPMTSTGIEIEIVLERFSFLDGGIAHTEPDAIRLEHDGLLTGVDATHMAERLLWLSSTVMSSATVAA